MSRYTSKVFTIPASEIAHNYFFALKTHDFLVLAFEGKITVLRDI